MTTKELLNQNIPSEVVEEREAWRGGPKLSYLSGAYVINRLNEVLGQGYWGYSIKTMLNVHEGTITQSSGDVFTTSYITTLSFFAIIDKHTTTFEEVGYGDGTDKKSKGKAHELAAKESVTDALKRAAKNLGISMGLGLYFKSGEYVDDEVSKTAPNKATVGVPKESPKAAGKASPESSKTDTSGDTKVLRQKIKSAFSVLEAQKKLDKQTFTKDYMDGGKVDDASDNQIFIAMERLKLNFAELPL